MHDSQSVIHAAHHLIPCLVAIVKNVAIYPPGHPSVIDPAAKACTALRGVFARRSCVTFHVVNSELYVEKQLLRNESIKYPDFVQLLERRRINGLSFGPGITPESLAVFFSLINGKEAAGLDRELLRIRMQNEGISGIGLEELLPLGLAEEAYELVEEESGSETARSAYENTLDCMRAVEEDILSNNSIDATAAQAVVSSLIEDFLNDRDAMTGVMSIKNYDDYLFHHSVNVAITTLALARRLSLDDHQLRMAGLAGLLHDIGKVKIPREITNKPGRLTESEWMVMRRHPIEGAQIIMRYESLGGLTALAALEHHAGYDLSGYPSLRGKQRPHALALIVGVADAYEAMTASRSYRPPHPLQTAVDVMIEGAGKQFDPLLVKLLLHTVGVFPPGSRVRLMNGETALVVQPNEDNPFLPRVRILGDPAADPTESPVIDTATDASKYGVAAVAEPEKV